jgi:hypothetical protein
MKTLLVATALVLSTASANAYDENYMSIGLGAHGAFDKQDKLAANLEWKGKRFDHDMLGVTNVSPLVGAMVDSEGDLYGFAGLLYDWNVDGQWHIVPSFAAGLYNTADNGGIDLGGALQFRYGAEVNYALTPQSQIGMSLYQISNFGIYDTNPATEDVMVNYSFAY